MKRKKGAIGKKPVAGKGHQGYRYGETDNG